MTNPLNASGTLHADLVAALKDRGTRERVELALVHEISGVEFGDRLMNIQYADLDENAHDHATKLQDCAAAVARLLWITLDEEVSILPGVVKDGIASIEALLNLSRCARVAANKAARKEGA